MFSYLYFMYMFSLHFILFQNSYKWFKAGLGNLAMEAIPKLPMISFQAKTSPENVDFASKLRQLIAEKFGENPTAFANEIKEMETLRYFSQYSTHMVLSFHMCQVKETSMNLNDSSINILS